MIDDVDGDEAAETVAFGLDGVAYEIDVSSERRGSPVDDGRLSRLGGGDGRRQGDGLAAEVVVRTSVFIGIIGTIIGFVTRTRRRREALDFEVQMMLHAVDDPDD